MPTVALVSLAMTHDQALTSSALAAVDSVGTGPASLPAHALLAGAVLESPDPAASAAFLAVLFGWRFERRDGGALQGLAPDGRATALVVPENGRQGWVPVFSVPGGLEALTAATGFAAAAGCQLEPAWVQGALRVTDGWGNVFGLVAAERPAAQLATMPDWLSLVDVAVESRAEPQAFYAELLHAEPVELPDSLYVLLCRDRRPMAALWAPESDLGKTLWAPSSAGWAVHLAVPACDPVVALALEVGARLRVPTTPSPVGAFAELLDPLGARVGVSVRNSDAERVASAVATPTAEPRSP